MPIRSSLGPASWLTLSLVLPAAVWLGGREAAPGAGTAKEGSRPRRPVALALVDGGKALLVANRRTGSVSVIDTAAARVAGEANVGRGLADIAATGGGRLLAVDEVADELLVLKRDGSELRVAGRLKLPSHPVSVRASEDGTRCFVASSWARQVAVVDLADPARPTVRHTVEVPFVPREQLLLAKAGRLLVADSHGGHLAVVDVDRGKVEQTRTLPAHNIRGMVLSPSGESVLLGHQILNAVANTSRDDVHWGNLLTNNLRSVSVRHLLDAKADPLRDGVLEYLGDVGAGAADPAGLAVGPDGTSVVTLGGVDAVLVGGPKRGWHRLAVEGRPTAVVLGSEGRTAYVANTFADSISVLDLTANKVTGVIRLGEPPTLKASDRGEQLFYDGRLSHDGWLSCHSCHTDGHTNGLLNDNLSDGTFGTPKRVLSLLGVKDTGPWAWNGGVADLKEQIRASVATTMQGRKLTAAQVGDLEAYLKTLSPPPPLARETRGGKEQIGRGQAVFQKQGCAACHLAPSYTSPKAYDVGLPDEAGRVAFNPPSLRGVSQGVRFLHDNRAETLREVFTKHRHGLKGKLADADLDALHAFLISL